MKTAKRRGYSIAEVARLVGITSHVLRIWESRYGWPSPVREKNGYRRFYDDDLVAIRRFVALIAAGHKHEDLIKDGMPTWPDTHAHTSFDGLASLPYPSAREASCRVLDQLRAAITSRNGRALMQHLVEVACLVHPADRVPAGWLPALHGLVAWEAIARPMPDAGEAWRFIRDQVGAATLATLMERVRAEPRRDEG
jgi:DNA-binding transcriptional MerR regulator